MTTRSWRKQKQDHWISEMIDNGQWMDVVNPANEEVIGKVPSCGESELDRAVSAARAAFKTWRRTTPAERQQDASRR